MRRTMKKALKITGIVLAALIGVVLIIAGVFAIKGAILWNEAKSELSVERAAENIRAAEDFVPYGELPEFYINAVISVEDRRFEKHSGISVKSIIRAAFYDIVTKSAGQGGSTITQQLAKNIWFTQEKKMERKFAEVYAAFAMENELSKNEIFELYVNSIYFGSDYYGIGAAARGYFGKAPSELTDYECALLAGLPNAPSAYSLDEAPKLARQRAEQVLKSMQDNRVLTDEEFEEVLAQGEIMLIFE